MPKKILLIHEDQKVCDSLRQIFVSYGYDVVQLCKTDDAMSLIANENPDAIMVSPELIGDDIDSLLARLYGRHSANADLHSENLDSALASSLELAKAAALNAEAAEKLKQFQSLYLAVKAKYARALPQKIEELGRDIQAAMHESEDNEALEPVRLLAHRLMGTAGTYGFEEFSRHMGAIEKAVINIARSPDEEELKTLWNLIEESLRMGMAEAESIATSAAELEAAKTSEDGPSVGAVLARVLIVDEDEAFLDLVEQLGLQCNVTVVKALNQGMAMNAALMHQIDAAIIDVKPELQENAFKLAIDLRSLPGYDSLPLAFISLAANPERPEVEAAHVGASLHLDKPIDAGALEAAVRHLVSIRQGIRPKVMVMDDDPDFTAKIALDLRKDNLLVRTVHDPLKLLKALQEFPPDVLLLDVIMPGMNGYEVCQMLRGMPRWRDLPIIFITAEIHIDARVKAFTSGGDDYLPKPVVAEELLARVRVRLEKSRLLKERSDKDSITGLLLRRSFVEQFSAMLADAARSQSCLSICLMDLDNFKHVNDNYGHVVGDKVLAGFGSLLLRRFRVDDIRGRWGGEQFIIAFRREQKETVRAAIERIQEEFSKLAFESDDGEQFNVTFSGGIATYPDDGESFPELLTVADKRLSEAKNAGRRRVFVNDNE